MGAEQLLQFVLGKDLGHEDFGVGRCRLERAKRVGVREAEIGRENSDYGAGTAIERDVAAHQRRVGMEPAAPQAVGQDSDSVPTFLLLIVAKIAALRRPDTEDAEEVCRHEGRIQALRLSPPSQVQRPEIEHGHTLQRRARFAPLDEVAGVDGQRGIQLGHRRDDLANTHQAVRLRVRKGLEQDAVHQREHRAGGTEAQSEHENRRHGEPGLPEQGPHGVAEIARELHANSNWNWTRQFPRC